jgi:phasin family protein
MILIIEPLLASIENQSKAIDSLTALGLESADRWAELNAYASLAAIDNTAHHLSTLAMSKDIDEAFDHQIKFVLPALECVKAYAGQVLALTQATSHDLGQIVESNLPRV